jgi:putative ABC transport system substrate-binding protein
MNARRRLLAGLAGFPLAGLGSALAQPPMKRLGVLLLPPKADVEAHYDGTAMASFGWVLGKTLEKRWHSVDNDPSRLDRVAQELVAARPDVAFCAGVPSTRALQKASRTLPICTVVDDPVIHGFAKTLRRPGGNITGLSEGAEESAHKEIELLRTVLPGTSRLAIVSAFSDSNFLEDNSRSLIAAARGARLQVMVRHLGSPKDLEDCIKWAGRGGVVYVRQMSPREAVPIAKLCAAAGVPVIGQEEDMLESGLLMTFRLIVADDYQLAAMLDRLLRGGNPAEIPFEMPTRSVFGINRKAAEALGVRFPADFIVRADRVV